MAGPDRRGEIDASPTFDPDHPVPGDQIETFRTALTHADEAIRRRAVHSLQGAAEDPAVRCLLREQLANPDDLVRHGAILTLALDPDAELVEDFFDLLPHEPARIQELMIRGLGRLLGERGAVADRVLDRMPPLLAADDERIRDAAAKLVAATPDKVAFLRRFFRHANGLAFWLRDRSLGALARVSGDLSDAVLELLRDPDVDVVLGATALAGKSGDPRLLPGLAGVLGGVLDWSVKLPILERIAGFPGPHVTPLLLAALGEAELREAALACLGRRAEAGTLPEVRRYLGDPNRALRRAALQSLRNFRDPVLLGDFERIVREDPDGDCRLLALEVLEDFGAEGVAAAEAIRLEWKSASNASAPESALGMLHSDLQRDL